MNNPELVRYFYETVVTRHQLERLPECLSAGCVLREGEAIRPLGIDGMRAHLEAVRQTYPDYTMRIVRQYCDGDTVISEFVMEGTHQGEYLGISPTHRRLAFSGVNVDRLSGGKMVEHSGVVNTFEVFWANGLILPAQK